MDFINSLHERAKACKSRILFSEGGDSRVREAVRNIKERGLAEPVLVGTRSDEIPGIELIDVEHPDLRAQVAMEIVKARGKKGGMNETMAYELAASPLLAANALVRWGHADGCVSGASYVTAEVIRAGLWLIGLSENVKTLSSAFYMDVNPFRGKDREVLTFTDCAVVKRPTSLQLAHIAIAAAADRRRIVGDEPQVAFLSFSTRGSGRGDSVDRIREAMEQLRALAPELAVDGELQGDAALIETVAARKAPSSAVAGRANILVFPDLDSGNIAYKLVQRLAAARAIGPILQGMSRPCNDLSRGASAEDIFNVAAITALQAGDHVATRLNGSVRRQANELLDQEAG